MKAHRNQNRAHAAEALDDFPATDELRRPIFIAGGGRSGTTLLRSLLSAHSRISISPETHFLKRAEQWGWPERAGPEDFDRFWSRYTRSVRFRDLGVDADECRSFIERVGPPTFRSIFATILTAYRRRVQKERIGEKTPGHVHFIGELLSWFPDARILILRRDPRAVVASQMRSPWVRERITPRSLQDGIVMGSHLHQIAFYTHDWATMYGRVVPAHRDDPRLLVVPYESLVQRAEQELRKICDFLDEEFEPAMLHDRSNDNVPIPASTHDLNNEYWREWRKEHHAKTLEPVSTASLEKWRRHLDKNEVAMVEGYCFRWMEAAGYVPELSASTHRRGRRRVRSLLALEKAESGIHTVLKETRTLAARVYGGVRRRLISAR